MVKQWLWVLPGRGGGGGGEGGVRAVGGRGWGGTGFAAWVRCCSEPRRRRTAIVELRSLPKLHSGKACSNPSPPSVALLSLTVTRHIAVCVRITWYHTWMMEAKWYCVGEPLLSPCLQHRGNQQKWPFMHRVWVLNRVTSAWAHLNIMYLCNELELELFWTDGTNYCLSYVELDRNSSRSTLCQMVDSRFLVPVLFTIDLCQWFFVSLL